MTFLEFANYLTKLENTSKRLEITDILAELISNLTPQNVDKALYLSLGYLKAPFETNRFNIANKMMIKAISVAYETPENTINEIFGKTGDLGETLLQLNPKKTDNTLSITQVYEHLLKIANLEGTGSQDKKISQTAELLTKLNPTSAKFVTRIVLGTTRLGFTELTIIDALSQVTVGDKSARKQIEATYNSHPDIGLLAKTIKQSGLDGLSEIKLKVGVPILPQKAQRISSIEEVIEKMGSVWGEFKFDGTRVQLHIDKNQTIKTTSLEQKGLFSSETPTRTFIKTFTRNLEETTYQYPDIVEAAENHLNVQSAILDGEAIGFDRETGEFLPFQQIMQRKRKHDVKEMAKKVPLKYFAFDLLYLNGNSLLGQPLTQRRKKLEEIVQKNDVILVDEHVVANTLKKVKEYFDVAREKGLEGLIVKKPDAAYQAGARNYTWVKLKVADTKLLDDSVDCVVLGYYFGKGVRAKFGIGGFLVGVYDKESNNFKSITKVGTGLKDEDWEHLKEIADNQKVDKQPKNVEIDKIYNPDVWLNPSIVVELGADEISVSKTHTSGYALRFPRLIKFRPDKSAIDTTSLEEITDLYNMQKRGYY